MRKILKLFLAYSADPASGQTVSAFANGGVYGNTVSLGPQSTDSFPNYLLHSVKSLHNMIFIQFDDTNPSNNQFQVVTGNPGTNTFDINPAAWISVHTNYTDAPNPPFLFVSGKVIGPSFYPDSNSSKDRTYWLFRDQTTNNFLEGEFDISQTGFATPGTPLRGLGTYDVSSFVGNHAKRVLYCYDPIRNRSYVSVWNSPLAQGGWSTWVWVDNNPVPTNWQLTSITNRIDTLLTTGELFSTDGNIGRVYDPTTPTGNLEAQFSLQSLRYVDEEYIGGTPTVLFSQALWYNQQLTFNVYSIPTSQLKTLGE